MNLDEFTNFIVAFIEKDCPMRDIPLFYNYSIRLQISEVDYDRHYNLIFSEFLEAFCRVIDRASPIPVGSVEVGFYIKTLGRMAARAKRKTKINRKAWKY